MKVKLLYNYLLYEFDCMGLYENKRVVLYQLVRWGRVPWAHELNQAELTARVAASCLVIHAAVEKNSLSVKNRSEQGS